MRLEVLLAGSKSLDWHPLFSDFVILGQKLEQLGFTYYKGIVTIIGISSPELKYA